MMPPASGNVYPARPLFRPHPAVIPTAYRPAATVGSVPKVPPSGKGLPPPKG
ncbi:hypothetical protein AZA_69583 [Nitrospirillum viridazoti Y2]|nr:hypothetical protein AZA_69583 [Nitrospirillum amazonense Y2]